VGNGDTGDNTGGMGAYSPAPVVTKEVEKKILQQIIKPAIDGMKKEGNPFVGFLYAGLMINNGEPSVLEFNVRLGDPETQPQLARLDSDLASMMIFAMQGKLNEFTPKWNPAPAVCVVKAAQGYPDLPRKGDKIIGIEDAKETGALVSLAGVAFDRFGNLVTAGGRVLSVTKMGGHAGDFVGAKQKAYKALRFIYFLGEHFRTDIADRAINRRK
jgi:phosphoribosylamine--glycine ligase